MGLPWINITQLGKKGYGTAPTGFKVWPCPPLLEQTAGVLSRQLLRGWWNTRLTSTLWRWNAWVCASCLAQGQGSRQYSANVRRLDILTFQSVQHGNQYFRPFLLSQSHWVAEIKRDYLNNQHILQKFLLSFYGAFRKTLNSMRNKNWKTKHPFPGILFYRRHLWPPAPIRPTFE